MANSKDGETQARPEVTDDELVGVLRQMPVGVLVLGPDGEVRLANAAATTLLGLPEAELLGRVFPGLQLDLLAEDGTPLHDDDRPIGRAYRTSRAIGDMVIGLRPDADGERNWVLVDVVPQLAHDGSVKQVICTLSDITTRRETEMSLRESEQFVKTVLDSVEDGVIVYDAELRYRVWNRYMEERSGYLAEELLGRNALETFPQLIDNGMDHVLRRALAGEATDVPELAYEDRTGRVRWYTSCYAPHRNAAGQVIGVVGNVHEVTEHKRLEERLVYDAMHDALTGLPNRALFLDRLGRALERAKRRPLELFAVVFLDLDRFKVVNDSLGHQVGDQLLVKVADRLQAAVRSADTVARLGGDEFAVLMEDVEGVGDATRAAGRILSGISAPVDLAGRPVFTTGSIGIIIGALGYDSPEDVLRDADIAMYRAKAQGRGRHQVFDRSMHEQALALMTLETDLRRGLERREFRVYYQPVLSLSRGSITGFEALVRWHHPERGLISPDTFVPLAEETGLIVPLGRFVIEEACLQLHRWQTEMGLGSLSMAVNLSGRQFSHDTLPQEIAGAIRAARVDPACLTLEITESSIVEDTSRALTIVSDLKELGVRLHIDDFGIGYSSLSSLHRFPIDGLKIDRSFVGRMGESEDDLEIVRTVMLLAQSLHMECVAEGVETPEQLVQLRTLRCPYAQGYYLSRPMPAVEAGELIRSGRRW